MNQLNIVTQNAVSQWELHISRATQLLNQLSDEALNRQVAPGKNTGKYIVGHLIAIHDAMVQILGIGESEHSELYEIYVKNPDSDVDLQKNVQELRILWDESHARITNLVKTLLAEDWLGRHNAISDENFKANPLRNRLSVLLNRTNHFSYHLGQLRLLIS